MIFLFHHTLQKKRKWGWEWRKGGSGRGAERLGVGAGRRTSKQTTKKKKNRSKKSVSLLLRWWVGRGRRGEDREPGSSVQRVRLPAPPPIMYSTNPR